MADRISQLGDGCLSGNGELGNGLAEMSQVECKSLSIFTNFSSKLIHHMYAFPVFFFQRKRVPIITIHMPIFRCSSSFSFCLVIVAIKELGISSVVYWKIDEAGFFDCKCVMTCAYLEKRRVGQYVMILDYHWTSLGLLKNYSFSFLF